MSLDDFQALVIGVGSYRYFADLPETVSDATNLASVLVDPARCGYPRNGVRLLTEREANRDAILQAIEDLSVGADVDATTVVYFSGHGGYVEGAPELIYLCPGEADPDNLEATALSNEELSRALAGINTRRLVVILDACHASGAASFKGGAKGGAKASPWIGDVGDAFAQYQLRQGAGRIIFASSRRGQASWTYPTGHMSLFTYYLIEGLKGSAGSRGGDGLIRVFDLFDYVGAQVRARQAKQEPVLAAQEVTTNFPIALYLGGGQKTGEAGTEIDHVQELRDLIQRDAHKGIVAVVRYLRGLPVELLEAADVDLAEAELKLTSLNEKEKRLRVLGPHPAWQAERQEIILYFISLCLALQRAEQK